MPRLLLLNHVILFMGCSIYFGVGIFLVVFQLPLEPRLTPDNYALVFVEPVQNATQLFTWLTVMMYITAFIMLITEWFTGIRWVPIIILLALTTATVLTVVFLFDYNRELIEGIRDPERLRAVFHNWAHWARVRVAFWVIEWCAMTYWFYRMAFLARADR